MKRNTPNEGNEMEIDTATLEEIVEYAIINDSELYSHLSTSFGESNLLALTADVDAVRDATTDFVIMNADC